MRGDAGDRQRQRLGLERDRVDLRVRRRTGASRSNRPSAKPAPRSAQSSRRDLEARPRPMAGPAREPTPSRSSRWRRSVIPAASPRARTSAPAVRGSQTPATRTSARCSEQRHVGAAHRRRRAAGRAEDDALQPQQQRAQRRPAGPAPAGSASSGCRAKVELTTRNSLMNTPIGGKPTIARTPSASPQASSGWVVPRPLMSARRCVPLTWVTWPTAKKIADLVRLCMVMCSRPAKLATGPPMPKAKVMMPMCSIERVGEQPFDVAAAGRA